MHAPGANNAPRRDPVQQQSAQADIGESHNQLSGPIQNFDGITFTGFSPPDTVGDVGPDHYIQMVNASFAIYNKTGTLLAGPSNINTLWAGFGGECENENAGDPIVIYDQASERWLFSQFTSPSSAPFFMCIAISRTNNPVTGGWNLYAFDLPAAHDYMKYGLWPDGYYMSTFEGATLGAYVFDRANMLNGNAATFQYFNINALTGTRVTRILPADWDGATAPATGAANPFIRSVDGAVNGGNDRLEMWEFHTDWATPANSTFTLATTLTTAAFDSDMCGFNRNCIPQPNTAQGVDALSNRLMHRLQYRNINGTEH
ncbi:MAG: PKD domain-containing protein, partial [Chloroflexi bacterium]